jgi:hypothetical protein
MEKTPQLKYEFELWINGVFVADISKLATSRSYTIKRNDAEELQFTLDVKAFEEHCERAGRDPEATLVPYVTDVRVKRNGSYLFGTQVVDINYTFNEGGASMVVRATGFLDLFAARVITKNYSAEEATQIARDMLDETQAVYGDYGVINGPEQYDTGVDRDRNYIDQNIKDALLNLTDLIDGNFDFAFTYDRKFNTYEMQGTYRPNLKLTYPYNIKSISTPKTALNLYNYTIGLGSGFGEETVRSEVSDVDSRLNYGTRMRVVTFNSVEDQTVLDQNTAAENAKTKDLLVLPKLTVTGDFLDLNTVWVGDRIPVEIQGHPSLPLNDIYRIEQIAVTLDSNDAEDIGLTVDNYGFVQAVS